MRILLTTDTIGGVWMFTHELTSQLLQRGHGVALVSLGRAPSAQQRTSCERLAGTYGDAFRSESSLAPLEWMQANERAYSDGEPLLLGVAEEFSADLLHANQFCFGSLPVAIPRIVTAHSDVLSWAAACRPQGLEPSPWLERYIALVQRGLTDADLVTAPTLWMLEAVGRNFTIPSPTQVIANGRTIPPSANTVSKLRAVSVGRLWDEAKNLALLTKVDSPMPIIVAGEQNHEHASLASLPPQLQAMGALDERDLLTLFRESSLYLCASLYEPFGLAPLEAALCGCAVLAHDIPSLREVWGEAALYFHDQVSLEALLRFLEGAPERLREARLASQRRALTFTAARMADGYVALYEALLHPRREAPLYELAGHAG